MCRPCAQNCTSATVCLLLLRRNWEPSVRVSDRRNWSAGTSCCEPSYPSLLCWCWMYSKNTVLPASDLRSGMDWTTWQRTVPWRWLPLKSKMYHGHLLYLIPEHTGDNIWQNIWNHAWRKTIPGVIVHWNKTGKGRQTKMMEVFVGIFRGKEDRIEWKGWLKYQDNPDKIFS